MTSFEKVLKTLHIDKDDIDKQIVKNTNEILVLKQSLENAEAHNLSLRNYSSEIGAAIRLLEGAFDSGDNSGEG